MFGPDRTCASFNLKFERARIVKAVYRCTTCVTLVAFCEHLSELVVGMPAERALNLDAEYLLRCHREVPAERRDRAFLAVTALKIAVQFSVQRNHQ